MEEKVVLYERKSGNFDEFFKKKRRKAMNFGDKEHTPTLPVLRCIWKWNLLAGKGWGANMAVDGERFGGVSGRNGAVVLERAAKASEGLNRNTFARSCSTLVEAIGRS